MKISHKIQNTFLQTLTLDNILHTPSLNLYLPWKLKPVVIMRKSFNWRLVSQGTVKNHIRTKATGPPRHCNIRSEQNSHQGHPCDHHFIVNCACTKTAPNYKLRGSGARFSKVPGPISVLGDKCFLTEVNFC